MEKEQLDVYYDEKDLNDFFRKLDIDINLINLKDIERIERNEKVRSRYRKVMFGCHYIYMRII